ncbi:hypothetical protein [Kineobactrum salinum]|uniref:Uncharacterized protein n=1 Tax=Kineobactrum salinum TaxID=2708301 RepID=A0A6C0U4V1_9GAMM|nr:hypothetical protein [Kineobactrum salinum]QIB67182.1 hypothetical protein G3T16_19000 [Kineobactrum salinum]
MIRHRMLRAAGGREFPSGPGPQEMLYDAGAGLGYYGVATHAEMGVGTFFADGGAAGVGGTQLYETPDWYKFYVDISADFNEEGRSYVIFMAARPVRRAVSWEMIYQAGLVYGTDGTGAYPSGSPTNQLRTLPIGAAGDTAKVRLLGDDPTLDPPETVYANRSESYQLMGSLYSEDGPDYGWAVYSDADLMGDGSTGHNGWLMERSFDDATRRRLRGGSISVIGAFTNVATSTSYTNGWRPALVLL